MRAWETSLIPPRAVLATSTSRLDRVFGDSAAIAGYCEAPHCVSASSGDLTREPAFRKSKPPKEMARIEPVAQTKTKYARRAAIS